MAEKTVGLNVNKAYLYSNKFSSRVAKQEDLGGELLERSKKVIKATYDFSVSGGAASTITLKAAALPAKAVITNVWSDEQTALTSGGSATLKLVAGSTDLTAALAFDTAFTGVDSHALASSAEAIKLSAESDLKVTIGTAALTAGKVVWCVEYWVTD